MSDITVQIQQENHTVQIQQENQITVSSIGIQGESGAIVPISSNQEIDVTTNGKLNGSVLVYKTATSKWTATTTLDAQHMEGGHY